MKVLLFTLLLVAACAGKERSVELPDKKKDDKLQTNPETIKPKGGDGTGTPLGNGKKDTKLPGDTDNGNTDGGDTGNGDGDSGGGDVGGNNGNGGGDIDGNNGNGDGDTGGGVTPPPDPGVPPPPQLSDKYKWVNAVNGEVPAGAIVAGTTGGAYLYLCRVVLSDMIQPGQATAEDGKCFITVNGDVYSSGTYQFLVMVNSHPVTESFGLVSAQGGNPVNNAFVAGEELTKPLNFCLVIFEGERRVGKVSQGYSGCKFPDNSGAELVATYYDILVTLP